MAHTYLIFDFGADEEAAQQARHKIDGWKQGFRLGNKMLLRFDREHTEAKTSNPEKAHTAEKRKTSKKENDSGENGHVRLVVRLDFSDHEKISHQRWLDRIPTEEPFKGVASEVIRHGDPEYEKTTELFESLD